MPQWGHLAYIANSRHVAATSFQVMPCVTESRLLQAIVHHWVITFDFLVNSLVQFTAQFNYTLPAERWFLIKDCFAKIHNSLQKIRLRVIYWAITMSLCSCLFFRKWILILIQHMTTDLFWVLCVLVCGCFDTFSGDANCEYFQNKLHYF